MSLIRGIQAPQRPNPAQHWQRRCKLVGARASSRTRTIDVVLAARISIGHRRLGERPYAVAARPPHMAGANGRRTAPVAAFEGAWLGFGSVHSTDVWLPSILYSLHALCKTYPQLTVIVNHFDDTPPPSRRGTELIPQQLASEPRIATTWVPGMRSLFWKLVLTPRRARAFSVVFEFDSDIAMHPSVLPLGSIASALSATGASLVQPSIRSATGHGTFHKHLRVRAAHTSCLATTALFIEAQLPLFRASAWAAFHERVLSAIADTDLAKSDYGLDQTWCGFLAHAFPDRPACLVLPTESVLHTTTKNIERYMNASTRLAERSCTHSGTCRTLASRFPTWYKNFSHNTKDCWGATTFGLTSRGKKFSLGDGGVVYARMAAEESGTLRDATDDPSTIARFVGATSINSRAPGLPELLVAMKSLLDALPNLWILLNLQDESPKKLMATKELQNRRLMVTQVVGRSAVPFWRRELTVSRLKGIETVFIFDSRLAVHLAVFPLPSFLAAREQIDAAILQPTIRGTSSGATTEREFARVQDGCMATTVAAIQFEATLFSYRAWRLVLQRLDEKRDDLSSLAAKACKAAAEQVSVACVLLRSSAVLTGGTRLGLQDGSDHAEQNAGYYSTPPGVFIANRSTARHDDGRCWGISNTGWCSTGNRLGEAAEERRRRRARLARERGGVWKCKRGDCHFSRPRNREAPMLERRTSYCRERVA